MQILIDEKGKTLDLELNEKVFRPSVASTSLLFSMLDSDLQGADVFEVGVGTGYIGLGLLQRGAKSLVGSDISSDAVSLATENAKLNGFLDLSEFFLGNIFSRSDGSSSSKKQFDLIVSNPPLMPCALERHEYGSWESTDGGELGDQIVNTILKEGPQYLRPDGVLYLPIFSFSNPEKVKSLARELFARTEIVSTHDVIFDSRKLGSWELFSRIFDSNCGYDVRHNGHPYWRIEILRCSNPIVARDNV